MILYRNSMNKVARPAYGILRPLTKMRPACSFVNANQRSVKKLHLFGIQLPPSPQSLNSAAEISQSLESMCIIKGDNSGGYMDMSIFWR